MTVATWWVSLRAVAVFNIAAWTLVATTGHVAADSTQLLLSGIYVFGCAFRSFVPVYDIPRIGMVDSRVSSILVGRTVATLAELAFAAQWAVYLHASPLDSVRRVSLVIVPLIAIAQMCCWWSVLTTSNRGHVFENSLWGVSAALIVACLVTIAAYFPATRGFLLATWAVGGALYVAYIFIVDVPMYWSRWKADQAAKRQYLSVAQGIVDLARRRVVSRRWEDWRGEVVWMSLYFSVGVWVSLSLIVARQGDAAAP